MTHLVKPYTAREKAGIARRQWFAERGRGYFAEQSTQPQTIGYSLADSPVGLLTWIYEKLVNWTDDYPWDDDEGTGISSLFVSAPDHDRPFSPSMGIGLLVFKIWTCSICEDLLRKRRKQRFLPVWGDICSPWDLLLSERDVSFSEKVSDRLY